MTEQTAQKVANVALGAAALGATYVVRADAAAAADGGRPGDDGADGRDPRVAGAGGPARVGSEWSARDMMTA